MKLESNNDFLVWSMRCVVGSQSEDRAVASDVVRPKVTVWIVTSSEEDT